MPIYMYTGWKRNVEIGLTPGAEQDFASSPQYLRDPRVIFSEIFQLENNHNLGKRNDLQSVNRTVGIVLGVLFGVLFIIVIPSLCIYRCTHAHRRYQYNGRRFHRRRGHKMLLFGKRAISTQGEGGQGGLGMNGQPGEQGQQGGEGHTTVGAGLLNNNKTLGRGGGASTLEGYNISHFQKHESQGNDTEQGGGGGRGTGGAAYGGLGGGGGTGGRGGEGGRGGQGGQATARAEAYASVYALMMCCVQAPPRRGPRGPKIPGPYVVGAPGPQGFAGVRPQRPPGEPGRPSHDSLRLEQEQFHRQRERESSPRVVIRNLNAGGAGGGGKASGGQGGHGGEGGSGGLGGEGGGGGRGSARASASTPIYPQLMCCVFVRPYPEHLGSHQEHK